MFRYLQFYVAAAIVIGACVYWPLSSLINAANSASSVEAAAQQVLLREAQLIDYFCLSRIPPAPGPASVPAVWSRALVSTIDLSESVGEVSGSFPEFSEKIDELNKLTSGATVYGRSNERHVLAYRPKESPQWFIVISKPVNSIRTTAAKELETFHPLRLTIATSLIGALLLTLMARFVIGSALDEKTK